MAKYKATPRLNELRKEKGFNSGKELAKMAGVTEPVISRFDSQKRYDIDVLFSVSKALDVSVDELFVIEENKDEK